jgi:hypothetical protein
VASDAPRKNSAKFAGPFLPRRQFLPCKPAENAGDEPLLDRRRGSGARPAELAACRKSEWAARRPPTRLLS